MSNLKYLMVILLASGLTYAGASLSRRQPGPQGSQPRTLAAPEGAGQAAGPRPLPAAAGGRNPGDVAKLGASLDVLGTASKARLTDEDVAAYRVPVIEPNPLQMLSVNATSAEVQRSAGDLHSWLKLTSEQSVSDCWRKERLSRPIWVELSADIAVGDGEALAVENLRLVKIHGTYQLTEKEASCFKQALSGISARPDQTGATALAPHLPLTEHFAFQYPCLACRAFRL